MDPAWLSNGESEEEKEVSKSMTPRKKKQGKMERIKAHSKANFCKLSVFEKNIRLQELSKEIKVVKA
jgi:hypothetical protein